MAKDQVKSHVMFEKEITKHLSCPVCKGELLYEKNKFTCKNESISFPIINGIPILINEENSIFKISDFVEEKNTTFDLHVSHVKKIFFRLIPKISNNLAAKENYKYLISLLKGKSNPKILIVGGSIIGKGMNEFLDEQNFSFTETDVTFGPRTQIILDSHDIPFEDNVFDCIIVQAVLEHVLDPYRCVSEMHRVLKSEGLIYGETPFMQQVHMGAFDFTRFSHLGHRRLFRKFEELKSGPSGGPGQALAWAYKHFLISFTKNRKIRNILIIFAHFTSFFLKYFDIFTKNNPVVLDSAAGYYFIGKKKREALPDKKLILEYKGVQ